MSGSPKEDFYFRTPTGMTARVFEEIAEDELAEDPDAEKGPPFGDAASDYDTVIKPFYDYWLNFATVHAFYGSDKYNVRDVSSLHSAPNCSLSNQGPDRYARRAMEKENKKEREARRREYNQEVRALASYVRKRDKRVVAFQAVLKEREEEKERARLAKIEQQKQAAIAAKLAFDQSDEGKRLQAELEKHMAELDLQMKREFGDENDDSEVEGIECVACEKVFKNEKSWESHQRSKKHIKAVELLRAELQQDDELVEDDAESDKDEPVSTPRPESDDENSDGEAAQPAAPQPAKQPAAPARDQANSDDDDDNARPKKGKKKKSKAQRPPSPVAADDGDSDGEEAGPGTDAAGADEKAQRRKEARARRQARKADKADKEKPPAKPTKKGSK